MCGLRKTLFLGWMIAALAVTGCAGGAMTPQQQEARELREYCNAHTTDLERCGVFFAGPGG